MNDGNRSLLIVLCSFFVFCLFASQASAAVRLVHTTDTNACSISEVPDATYTKIQDAIDASAHGDIIRVCAGIYDERIDYYGKRVNLVSVSGRAATVIDARTDDLNITNRAVVTFKSGEGGNSILDGFTLTNGEGYSTEEEFTCIGSTQCAAPVDSVCEAGCSLFGGSCYNVSSVMLPHKRGGGVYCNGTSPRIRNCKIEGNSAHYGGGVYLDHASPIIENCIIGGVDSLEKNSSISAAEDLTLNEIIGTSGCNPSEVSYGGEGGGMYLWYSSGVTIKDNTISKNESSNGGGGIYMYSSSPSIVNNDITDNRSFWGGGGIECDNSSPTIDNNRLLRNVARDDGQDPDGVIPDPDRNPGGRIGGGTGKGGGILCWASSFPTITNCDISYNGATYGGGIHCDESDPTVSDCTITYNSAWNAGRSNSDTGMIDAVFSFGGGVYTYRASPVLTRCDISHNFASVAGGGVYSENYVDYNGKDSLLPDDGLQLPRLISPELYKCNISFNGAGVLPATFGMGGGEAPVPGIPGHGGGIACQYGCSLQIKNSIIANNMVSGYGGGMATGEYYEPCTGDNLNGAQCWSNDDSPTGWDPPDLPVSEPEITNCTIVGNEKQAILADNNSRPKIVNTIIWGNVESLAFNDLLDGSRQIDHRNNPDVHPRSYWYDDYSVVPNIIKDVPVGSADITYSNVEGGFVGVGNINLEPHFLDEAAGNYMLKYLPLSIPPVISPSIDTGDPATTLADDIDGTPRPIDIEDVPPGVSNPQANAFDMGAYEMCTVLSTFYRDADGDTFGDPNSSVLKCVAPQGYVDNTDDCDDTNAEINPNTLWYLDVDGDGFGSDLLSTQVSGCVRPGSNYYLESELVTGGLSSDCDDSNAEINPNTLWYLDVDGDGYGSDQLSTQVSACVRPGSDYYLESELLGGLSNDCDDSNPDINPGTFWFKDADGDGHSDGTRSEATCIRPDGYFLLSELLSSGGDCDDDDPIANPDTRWYLDADGDGYTDDTLPNAVMTQCTSPGVGYYREDSTHIIGISGDCDDGDSNLIGISWYLDADGDGYVDESNPVQSQCTSPGATYHQEADLLGISGDCEDDVDNDFRAASMSPETVWYLDADGDGYGSDQVITQRFGCTEPLEPNYLLAFQLVLGGETSDCRDDPNDDYSRWVNPSQPEICNDPDIDDNCNGKFAGEYLYEQFISSGIVHDSPPKMSASKVVWSSRLSGVGELNKIRVYDMASASIVADLNGGINGAIAPYISENGNVVWAEGTDVFLYEPSGSVTNISGGMGDDNVEAWVNDAGDVAWESYSSVYDIDLDEDVDQYEVFLKPYGLPAMNITPAPHDMKLFPRIIGNGNVVFANSQVYLYKTSLSTTLLSNGFNFASSADMNESGKVVWSGSLPGDNEEVYLYDSVVGGAPVALTSTASPARSSEAKINAVGDVVWQEWNGTNSDIYVRYAGTTSNVRITYTTYMNTNPEINDDGTMVWQALFDNGVVGDANNGDSEIFMCKGDKMLSAMSDEVCDGGNLPSQVTNNAYNDRDPTINIVGDVAWRRVIITTDIKICLKRIEVCVEGNTYYRDIDGDGFGDSTRPIEIPDTVLPAGYSLVGGDCDDTNPLIHEGCGGAPKISVNQGNYVDGYFVVDVPTIQSEGSPGVTSEASIRITATITVDGLANASLYYRSGTDGELTRISMTSKGGGIFVADVPLDTFTSRIEYFIIAEDADDVILKDSRFADGENVQTPTLGEWGVVLLLFMFVVATYKKLSLNNC